MELDLEYIESQLKQRWPYPYEWGQKQNNRWDQLTRFIYKTPEWDELVDLIKLTYEAYDLDKKALFQYAANRWYNFWSAMAVEQIFTQIEGVTPALNHKNRLVDFSCFGIDFDHKTTVFPKAYNATLSYAQNHKKDLLTWLYDNQSQQGRKHLKNRLFIVVYEKNGAHWKLKAELFWLQHKIANYLRFFDPSDLIRLQYTKSEPTLADIIWAIA